jgi:hypothetical protein
VTELRNGAPMDCVDYGADRMAGAGMGRPLEWRRLCSFRELYGARDASQEELAAVVGRLRVDSGLMWKYQRAMHLGHFAWRAFHGCLLTAVLPDELEECARSAPDWTRWIVHAGRSYSSM